MAVYTYTCNNCKNNVDIARGISDPEGLYECDTCGSVMSRVYSSPSIQFSGSGFYSTDKSK